MPAAKAAPLLGRIDVPPEAIATEASMRNGKAYRYSGPTPALMRLPLELLLPGMYGRWGALLARSAGGGVAGSSRPLD
jgi:hypothetical protein